MNQLQELDDKQLMESVAGGDKIAFAEFIKRYLAKVVDFAMRYVTQKTDAEDIAQEAFIRLWRSAPNWRDKQIPVQNWLYRITYNLCMDELRKRKPEPLNEEELVTSELDSPESHLNEMTQQKKLDAALQTLPERQRTALVLCAYHGFSNRDAASVLDISVDALESLLSRARRSLRKQLMKPEGISL